MARPNTMGAADSDPIMRRLEGRVRYLHNVGRVKDPELMMTAWELLSELTDAAEQLLIDLGRPAGARDPECNARLQMVVNKVKGR